MKEASLAFALVTVAAVLATVGCTNTVSLSGASPAIPMVRAQAETDLDCPQADIRIQEQLGGRFLVTGCGKKAIFQAQCVGLQCKIRGENDRSIPFRDGPDPDSPLLR